MQNTIMVDFSKSPDQLVPVIVQDASTNIVLMLGYMNKQALQKSCTEGKVTFFSRSKQRLWTKGETSGNYLHIVSLRLDCDNDTILIHANPTGPTCHTGTDTFFGQENKPQSLPPTHFLEHLGKVIESRKGSDPTQSYTASLMSKGINKVAQKVGEEAIELIIEAKDNNPHLFLNEAADLMYHYLVLLSSKGFTLEDVTDILKERHT